MLWAAFGTTTILCILGVLTSLWLWQVKEWDITVDWDGRLLAVLPGSPAAQAGVQPGDSITFFDFQRLNYLAGHSQAGQETQVVITHDGQSRVITLAAHPATLSQSVERSVVTWVGIGFVLLGVVPLFARRRNFTLAMFFLAAEVTGLFLIAQKPRVYHLFWEEVATYLALPLFPALLFHFHTLFPQRKLGRWRKRLVALGYAWGAVILPFNLPVLWDWSYRTPDPAIILTELYICTALLSCLALLAHTFVTTRDRRIRAQLKIITVCSGLGLAINPLLMVPALLFSLDISYTLENLSVIAALLSPIGYAYSILRYDLLVDGLLWRRWLLRAMVASGFSIAGLLGVFALFRDDRLAGEDLIAVGLLLALAGIALGIVNTLVGEWLENHLFNPHIKLLDFATDELHRFHTLDQFVRFFTHTLPAQLQVQGTMVFLTGDSERSMILCGASSTLSTQAYPDDPLQISENLAALLRSVNAPVAPTNLLVLPSLLNGDFRLVERLTAARMELVLPLVSHQQARLIGLVALGSKATDEAYSTQEITTLATIGRTAAASAENVLLFEEQQQRLQELAAEREYRAALARQVNTEQERARKEISRQLHDTAVQELGEVRRGLTAMREVLEALITEAITQIRALERAEAGQPPSPTLQRLQEKKLQLEALLGEDSEITAPMPAAFVQASQSLATRPTVVGLITQSQLTWQILRNILDDLHPGWSNSALSQILRAHVDRLQTQRPNSVLRLLIEGEEPAEMGDEVKIAAKHILDQAIKNAWLHGQASTITVRLAFVDQINLEVTDNGTGFTPLAPKELRAQGHHGLANMQERAELVGGQFRVESSVGTGTCIQVSLPFEVPVAPQPVHDARSTGDAGAVLNTGYLAHPQVKLHGVEQIQAQS